MEHDVREPAREGLCVKVREQRDCGCQHRGITTSRSLNSVLILILSTCSSLLRRASGRTTIRESVACVLLHVYYCRFMAVTVTKVRYAALAAVQQMARAKVLI
jgi:hypothetical protein